MPVVRDEFPSEASVILLPLIVSEPPPVGKLPPPKEFDKTMDEPFRTSIESALITTLEPFPGPNRLAAMPALPDMEKEPASMLIPGASPATGVALNVAPLNVVIP